MWTTRKQRLRLIWGVVMSARSQAYGKPQIERIDWPASWP